jgi:hypothetical protein
MKKKELTIFTIKLLSLFRHLFGEYHKITGFAHYEEAKAGDWGLEVTYLGHPTVESFLKLTEVKPETGSYKGIDMLGQEQSWNNASFIKLPPSCVDFLEGKYKW